MGTGSSASRGAKSLTGWYTVKLFDPPIKKNKFSKVTVEPVGRVKVFPTHLCYTDNDEDEYKLPLQNIIRYAWKDDVITIEVTGLSSSQRATLNRTIFTFQTINAGYIFKDVNKYSRRLAKDIFKSTQKMMKGVCA